jgi:hypothetical protein
MSTTHVARVTRFVGGRPLIVVPARWGDAEIGPCEILTSVPPLTEGDRVLVVEASNASIVVCGRLT